ncbi:kinase-like protein [Trametes meyenii]|nr:kinase-like protein [Trametes meyenii]
MIAALTGMFSHLGWAIWRCFPAFIRLACYRWLGRYGDTRYGIRVRILPFGLVTKGGWGSPHTEADNIRFVAKHTTIPVPHVLDVIEYPVPKTGMSPPSGMIVMSRLEGESLNKWISDHAVRTPEQQALLEHLDACLAKGDMSDISEVVERLKHMPLPTLNLSDAEPLMQDLREALRQLRSIEPPSQAVAGLFGRPLRCSRGGECLTLGPFKDQREFKDAIFAQANSVLFAHRMPALHRLAEPSRAKTHRICFTHADLAARNILVKDGRLSGILDWEFSGWYPEYWELTTMESQMLNQPLMHQFWDAVQLFGNEPYRDELALEWALWRCTGTTAAMGDRGDDLSCPQTSRP